MKATSSANGPIYTSITPEAQAAALWMFVHSKAPRFTLPAARDVVGRLAMQPGEDPKSLAKRLRTILQTQRISLKHTHALHAASQLAGFKSWHTNETNEFARITFATIDVELVREAHFRTWNELAIELREWADRLIARSQLPLGVLVLGFSGRVLNLSTPVPPGKDDTQQRNQSWPLGTITSAIDDPQWLVGATAAIEKLRRHLEEGGHAVLDGYAALQLCANSHDDPAYPMAVTVSNVVNSELVLMREDNEDDPHGAYEIARGDELSCWHQLELSLRDDRTNEMPDIQIIIPKEGVGAWFVNGIRFVWNLETLLPHDGYAPGRVSRQIGIPDCERLLRRYLLAKRIHGRTFKHHDKTKRVDYLSGPPETYRVDLHFLLSLLNKADLTWEAYIKKFDVESIPITDTLPVGFVFQLLENLQIEKPNQVFARPNRSEMVKVEDDGLLRALMPRVEHVRFVVPRDLEDERASELKKAVEEFADSLHAYKMFNAGPLELEQELPHLVWVTDAEELRVTVESLGLVMYAATMPHLHFIKDYSVSVPDVKMWPWAFGNALFLRFESAGGTQ